MLSTLATCVPYFPDGGQVGRSLLLLGIAKPLTYLVFVLCFRYRVSTPGPLSHARIGVLVAVRTVAGVVVLISGAILLYNFRDGHLAGPDALGWAVLISERTIIWAMLGAWIAHLRGRRLLGWIISGVGIDLAFDFAVRAVYDGTWWESGLVGLGALCFLTPLYIIGRRPSLRAKFFARHVCRKCGYDLTGNVSSRCPECGTAVGWVPLP